MGELAVVESGWAKQEDKGSCIICAYGDMMIPK